MGVVSESEEIEVEVVEVVNEGPATRSSGGPAARPAGHPQPRTESSQRRPFGGMSARRLRVPVYLWPMAVIFGLLFLLLAVLILLVVVIPFLILRAILRLLLPAR